MLDALLNLTVLAGTLALSALIFVPRTVLCLAAGFVFGMSAFPVALIASTVGATLALVTSRFLFRPVFLRTPQSRPKLQSIARAIDAEGWRIIALMRLSSPLPGTGVNYLVGLTHIGVWPYTWATMLGSAVPVFFFTYLGSINRTVFDQHSISYGEIAFLLLGLPNFLIVAWLVARRLKQVLPPT
jgi:uncharacterized membrane protein YdjX (TVP38/TMEM64 family)